MTELPVTNIVLFKHGVGFFQRQGATEGSQLTLTFRQDAINDVLKSLVVFASGEAVVAGIHYQTPFDKDTLKDSSIRLSGDASLADLLRDLRGRRIEMYFAEGQVSGRLIGLDRLSGDNHGDSLITIIREEAERNNVEVYKLGSLHSFRLLDARAEHDLKFFLDSSMSEELRRDVTIRLSGEGQKDVFVSYIAPSPTWRVSYRLVAETGDDNQSGKALLQGWGLFDNRLDEDLEDVSVTLVAGQPISFIYDLFTSRIPQRRVIEDEARIAAGPVDFREERRAKRMPTTLGEFRDSGVPAPALMMPAAEASYMEMAGDSFAASATGQDAGEFFEYVVTNPVSVKRGESALVPIINAQMDYNRELLYNGEKFPKNPVVALRFTNSSGLTLERGPVTIIIDNDYKGEAIVPFTKDDGGVYLAYAVELGIQVSEHVDKFTRTSRLDIKDGYLLVNEYLVHRRTYKIDNTTSQEQVVTIEARISEEFELFDTPEPDAVTLTERRWKIAVPAHDIGEFVTHQRLLSRRREEIRSLSYRHLQHYFNNEVLDEKAFRRIEKILVNLSHIEDLNKEQIKLLGEQSRIYERQEQLRKNLTALNPSGDEGALRRRVLGDLEATEDRLAEIDGRLNDIKSEIAQANEEIDGILAELSQ